MTNEELVRRIQAGEDGSLGMAELYEQTKAFIHAIAGKYQGCGVDLEDLEQEGFLGLYDAVAGYNPQMGVKFLTYAKLWIRQKIVRCIQDNGSSLRIPVYAQEQQRAPRRFCAAFQLEHGRKPAEAEIAAHLGLTLEQVRERKENACKAALVSLDSPVRNADGEEDAALVELVASAGCLEDDVLEGVQQEELCSVLWTCVDDLPGALPEVIRRRYQGGETLRQIGEAIGITTEAVRQQEGKALRELRKPSRAARLLPFFPEAERIYNMGLKGGGAAQFDRTWTSSTERAALRLVESAEEILQKEKEETERMLAEYRA